MLTQDRYPTDEQLLNRIIQRDLRSFEMFYDKHAEVVYGLILHIVQDHALADEILQETFLQVWGQAESISHETEVAAWLYHVARQRSLDALRWTLRNSQQRTSLQDRICQQARSPLTTNTPYDFPSQLLVDFTDKSLQNQRQTVCKTFQAMSEDQRVSLSLTYFAGMTAQEIANYVNLSANWVKTLITDGIERLNAVAPALRQEQKEPA
ncbi:MAG: sigma-70 family RNA polymerase sigma factor [Caldilineaceae bacterium]